MNQQHVALLIDTIGAMRRLVPEYLLNELAGNPVFNTLQLIAQGQITAELKPVVDPSPKNAKTKS